MDARPYLSGKQAVAYVVLGDIPPEGADDDHGDDPGEEEHDHNRVDDGEPGCPPCRGRYPILQAHLAI